MRISDWSSDVCSSDLGAFADGELPRHGSSSMWRNILKYGVIAGLVVAAGMWGTLLAFGGNMPHGWFGMALGYLSMLVALSAVFVGLKAHRDVGRGGVIRFTSEKRRVGKEGGRTCK